ncbi:hypothetical protein Tco_0085558 [Tanacetum coccineum]
MMIKNPPLEQTGGPKEEDQEKNLNLPVLQEKRQPRKQERLLQNLSNLGKAICRERQDPRESFDELTDTTFDFFAFVMNRLNVKTLTPELLADDYKATTRKIGLDQPAEGRQYLMICDSHNRWSFQTLKVVDVIRFITPHQIDLEYQHGGDQAAILSLQLRRPRLADYGHIKRIEELRHARASSRTGKSDKTTQLEERIAFNVSLRMFTRSVVIQRRVEDLQLGVESYQKKLNLTKPDTTNPIFEKNDISLYTKLPITRGIHHENQRQKNRLRCALTNYTSSRWYSR